MSLITEEALQKAQAGDLESQTQFVRCYQSGVRSFIAMLTADVAEADDLAQETFLRAFERLDRVPSAENAGAFLRGIACNVALEHLRRRKMQAKRAQTWVQFMEDTVQKNATGGEWWSDDERLSSALRLCVESLPPKSRSALEWRYCEECDATEIGERMNMRADAVRALLKRLRLALWQCIEDRCPQTPASA